MAGITRGRYPPKNSGLADVDLDRRLIQVALSRRDPEGSDPTRGEHSGDLLDGRVGRRPTHSILSADVRRSGQLGCGERCGQLVDLDLPQGRVAELNEELVEDLGELPFEGGEAG